MQRKAFTLIELLVVIAIIAILAAILFPVFAQAKAAAKRTADLSNVKNIALAIPMYGADENDVLPPVQQGAWDTNPRYQFTIWKDSVLPYIKNGGRYTKPDGSAYKGTENRDGGIFNSPTYSGGWAPLPSDQGDNMFGDQTTRFPRSYAVNLDAGWNEGEGLRNGDNTGWDRRGIWPDLGRWSWQSIKSYGGSGNMTALQNPAGTIMLSGTRTPYVGTTANDLKYTCGGNQCDVSDNSVTQGRSVGNGLLNAAFFDGHSKAVKGVKTISDDAWDRFNDSASDKTDILQNMRGIKEWQ